MQMEIQKQSYRICSQCNFFKPKEISLKNEYCEKCGHELANACKKCHLEFNNPFAKHCKKCGEKIT